MESYLISSHYDLITPDGYIDSIRFIDAKNATAIVKIKHISPAFVGFSIDPSLIIFNLKSTLAQLGLDGTCTSIQLDKKNRCAEAQIHLKALMDVGSKLLLCLEKGAYIGKLFAADDRRKVRNPYYLMRMFDRKDQFGKPLLSFGNLGKKEDFVLEKINGFTIAFLALKNGTVNYDSSIDHLLPTIALMLKNPNLKTRELLHLHQRWEEGKPKMVRPEDFLLVKTTPLHVRTVFAKVVEPLLPQGFHHTSASVLQPNTEDSGDIYELFGSSSAEIKELPLEFYTLEPHREYVFFKDRDQLQEKLEDAQALFSAFETAPKDPPLASVFVVKGTQLANLSSEDWIARAPHKRQLPGISHPVMQAHLVEQYIEEQPSYPFLKAMEGNLITSQGVLLTRYFPSPLLKRMLLSTATQRCVKGIYFQHPSLSYDDFFSHEDRAFLLDLVKFAIPVFWIDQASKQILQYVIKPDKDAGMFVPLQLVETFRKATTFGVYGSNLIEGNFEQELHDLLEGILNMRKEVNHPLLCENTPLALVTGGGPGVMEVGNRVAKKLKILSCANVVDFRQKQDSYVNEQHINPYIDAKMTYRLDRLVERQAEFHLDFPIFLPGGIGMDFEMALEEVRRKVGACSPTPMLLLGEEEYWKRKITSRFQTNLASGMIKGSEWISNCFYCVQKAEQGLAIYRSYFEKKLPIGKNGPIYEKGFCTNFNPNESK